MHLARNRSIEPRIRIRDVFVEALDRVFNLLEQRDQLIIIEILWGSDIPGFLLDKPFQKVALG